MADDADDGLDPDVPLTRSGWPDVWPPVWAPWAAANPWKSVPGFFALGFVCNLVFDFQKGLLNALLGGVACAVFLPVMTCLAGRLLHRPDLAQAQPLSDGASLHN